MLVVTKVDDDFFFCLNPSLYLLQTVPTSLPPTLCFPYLASVSLTSAVLLSSVTGQKNGLSSSWGNRDSSSLGDNDLLSAEQVD